MSGRLKFWNGTTWVPVEAGSTSSLLTYTVPGTLVAGVGTIRLPIPVALVIESVIVSVATAPTGADILVDVHKNGTTIFSTQGDRPSIAAGTNVSSVKTPTSATSLAPGDYLTIDVDQIGSTEAGADLVVVIKVV